MLIGKIVWTVFVLVAGAMAMMFALVTQTGVDLSITSNLICFWALNLLIAGGVLWVLWNVWTQSSHDE